MLQWLSPEFRPFVGVFILAVLFVAVTSLIQKYRQWQAEKMRRAQRVMAGARQLELALRKLDGLVIPQELGEFCRSELLARYRGVQSMFPDFDGIGELIADIESRHPGRGGSWEVPQLANEATVNRHTAAMTLIIDLLAQGQLHGGLAPAAAKDLRDRARSLRAETRYAFYERQSLENARAGEWNKAQNDMLRLMAFLREKAPANARGKELYHGATDLYRHYNHRQMPDTDAPGPSSQVA